MLPRPLTAKAAQGTTETACETEASSWRTCALLADRKLRNATTFLTKMRKTKVLKETRVKRPNVTPWESGILDHFLGQNEIL